MWDALDAGSQRRWRRHLLCGAAHLAVRALGLRPAILAIAEIGDDLACAAQRHARDDAALRWALLPVALRAVAPVAAHALIAAMPSPPDPVMFFVIACEGSDPAIIDHVTIGKKRSALRTPANLACAVALQRSSHSLVAIRDRCTTLRRALHGRSRDDLTSMMQILDARARADLMPDPIGIAVRLAHPNRRDALRRALDRLAALPPEVAVPTHVVLMRWTSWNTADAAEALADALQTHGGVFLEIVDALADDLRTRLLPLPKDAALADALRALAQDDLPTARRLARACHDGDWRAAIRIVLALPAHHRAGVTPAAETLVTRLARHERREALRRALARLASLPPEVDIPARFALHRWGTESADASNAAESLADALQAHGDLFVAMADALAHDHLRPALLPLPEDAALADALRGLARDDPPTALLLAQALRTGSWRDALITLLHAPQGHAAAVWGALDNTVRWEIGAAIGAAMSDADPLAVHDPIAALALAALHADDADLHDAGVTALGARSGHVRAIWRQLPPKMQQTLGAMPDFADLSQSHARPAIRRGIRRRRA